MKKRPIIVLIAVAALVVAGFLVLGGEQLPEKTDTVSGRWYSSTMVLAGSRLFARNCASCHGATGEGAANWRQRGNDGFFPPPPLNGSGHAWHHSLKVLRASIERGGAGVGGAMPAFKDQLSREQQDAIIAYMQSHWPEEIYRIWARQIERID